MRPVLPARGPRRPGHHRAALVVAYAVVAATAAGCGGGTVPVAHTAAVGASDFVPAPGEVRVDVAGTTATVVWVAPQEVPEPLTGFRFHLDDAPAIPLEPTVLSRELVGLVEGSQHLVQVVATTAGGESFPATATFTVPYAARAAEAEQPVAGPAVGPPTSVSVAAPALSPAAVAAEGDAGVGTAAHLSVDARHTVKGTLTLLERRSYGTPCQGQGDFSDVRPGQEVVIRDAAARVIGTGTLQTGRPVNPQAGATTTTQCAFDFSVASVPETDLYGFTVGTRDARVVHSLSEMRSQDWTVAGSVG